MTSREAFEKELSDQGFYMERHDEWPDEYADTQTHNAWAGWDAAIIFSQKQGWLQHRPNCQVVYKSCNCGLDEFLREEKP